MSPASLQKSSSVKVDLVKQLVSYYPNDLAWATTADQIDEAFASGDHNHDHYDEDDNDDNVDDDDDQVELQALLVWSQGMPSETALPSLGLFTSGIDKMIMLLTPLCF